MTPPVPASRSRRLLAYPFSRRLMVCILLLCASGVAWATQATLTGDSFVSTSRPSSNFGGLSNLYVGNGNTALLQFDLSSLPAGTTAGQIAGATLRVYVNRVYTAGVVSMLPVISPWIESGVTSTTAPTLGTAAGSFSITQGYIYVAVDVTALVKGWVGTPSSNDGIAITASSASLVLDSKENDETGHPAQLDITLSGPQGPAGQVGLTGATGPAGPTGSQGIQGPAGPSGATGATGPVGATGVQGPPVAFRGPWTSSTTYAIGDAVFESGTSYIALVANVATDPATDVSGSGGHWAVLAEQGAMGATGPAGPPGPMGLIGATGATGPAGPIGPQGSIGLTGATGATGAAGPTGAPGATGATGPPGAAGPQGPLGLTGATGPTGTAGPTGATGATGAQGPPASFQGNWSSSTTYAVGDAVFCAACSNSGSSYVSLVANNVGFDPPTSNVKWSLLARQGATGAPGVMGATGLTGPQGVPGPQGPAGANGTNGSGVNAVSFAMEFINPGTNGGTTFYLSPLSTVGSPSPTQNNAIASSTESNFAAIPVTCTMSALNVGVNNYNVSASDTTTITVYKNQAATSMSCSVTTNGNGSGCHDITHTFSASAGDEISIAFVETNASPFNKVDVQVVCQ
jgi:hypothetical protein